MLSHNEHQFDMYHNYPTIMLSDRFVVQVVIFVIKQVQGPFPLMLSKPPYHQLRNVTL